MDIDSWKTKSYIKVKDVDKKLNYSAGIGYNKEGVYINESWGGGSNTLPLILPNGVTIDSHTNVTWPISKDETIMPWDAFAAACVVTAGVVVLAVAGPEIVLGGLVAEGGAIIAAVGNYVVAACSG
ncbi:hypothetical protein [Lacrimispora sp.]|uniref:hypothetical protein n=1 Tax=Lacrimispora sp. TaxID=2719234 RepID=UPI0039926A19